MSSNVITFFIGISIAAIEDLVVFYKAAKKAFDENENGFQDASRLEVVKLQSGTPRVMLSHKM